jgi:hypothetical protein
MKNWRKIKNFLEAMDMRKVEAGSIPQILKTVKNREIPAGTCVINRSQSPTLYSALDHLEYSHETDEVSENEYHVYFYKDKRSPLETQDGFTLDPGIALQLTEMLPDNPDLAMQLVALMRRDQKLARKRNHN